MEERNEPVALGIIDGPLPFREKRLELTDDLARLSPVRRKAVPRVPIYLLHGEGDPVVPVADLDRLARYLRARGASVSTHRTDLFSHVGRAPGETPSIFRAWPMLSFVADAMGDAGF